MDLKCRHVADRSSKNMLNDIEHPLPVFDTLMYDSSGFEEAHSGGLLDQNSSRDSCEAAEKVVAARCPSPSSRKSFQCSTEELLENITDKWH